MYTACICPYKAIWTDRQTDKTVLYGDLCICQSLYAYIWTSLTYIVRAKVINVCQVTVKLEELRQSVTHPT